MHTHIVFRLRLALCIECKTLNLKPIFYYDEISIQLYGLLLFAIYLQDFINTLSCSNQ